MTHIAIVGSINVDLTAYLTRWPDVGETIAVQDMKVALGGKGANQFVAAQRLGGSAFLIGAIGSDDFGTDVEKRLQDVGGTLCLTRLKTIPTGMAFIDVVPGGDNIIRISDGANGALTRVHIEQFADEIGSAAVLLLQNEIPLAASLAAAAIARQSGVTVIMDPAPAPKPGWSTQVLSAFDIMTPNAQETKSMLGRTPQTLTDAREAATALTKLGLRGAVVTMAELGAAWSWNGRSGTAGAPKVDAIDAVAAGDCFNGALAAALGDGLAMPDAIEFAVTAAALATTLKGAAQSIPAKSDVTAFRDLQTSERL